MFKVFKLRLFFIAAFAFFVLFNFSGCKKKEITFNSSDSLFIAPGFEWALVTDPYAALRKESDYESEVMTHLRQGEIKLIRGKNLVKTQEAAARQNAQYTVWYLFEDGWIEASAIKIFDTKLKAQTEAKKLNSK